MRKRIGLLLVVPAFVMLLSGCSETGEKIKTSAKKYWDNGIALLEKGAEKLGLKD